MAIDLPFEFNRIYKGPATADEVFTSTAALDAYLTSPVRYAGMIVSLNEGGDVTNYTLNSSEDAWIPLGSGAGGAPSTGVIVGGVLSIGTPTSTFSISDGNGVVVDSHTDANSPVTTDVEWSGLENLVLTDISSNFTGVAIDSTGAVVQRPNGTFTIEERRDFIVLGTLIHLDHLEVEDIDESPNITFGGLHSVQDMGAALGAINSIGNEYVPASNDLTIKKTAGIVFRLGSNYSNSTKNPNYLATPEDDPISFNYNHRDGLGGWTIDSDLSNVVPTLWDDGTGTLNTVNANNWSIQRLYYFPTSNITVMQYGQAEYNNLSKCIDGLLTENFEINPALSSAMLRGYLLIRGNTTDLSDLYKSIESLGDFYMKGCLINNPSHTFTEEDLEQANMQTA